MTRFALLFAAILLACTRPAPPTDGTSLGPPPPAEVRRVVTLAPSLSELVIAIGAGDRLVGVTRHDDAPEVANLPRIGGYSDPSAEAILRLRADVVLCQPSPGNRGAVETVAAAGVSVRVVSLETLADVNKAILDLGRLLGREAAAKAVVERIENARKQARSRASARGRKPRVALLVGVDPIVAAGPGSFTNELLVDAGAENVVAASAQTWPRLTDEALLAARPDFVLLAGVGTHGNAVTSVPEPLRARTVTLANDGILRPGPRVVDALDELSRVLDGKQP
jgi:iron complex transport system substrate-binding protein